MNTSTCSAPAARGSISPASPSRQKRPAASGAWIGGIALDVIGFPHGVNNPALLAHIPAETIRNLGIAYGPGASLFTAVSVAVLLTYKLTKADVVRIQADLKSRRAAKAAE